jgi:hypothetical protein
MASIRTATLPVTSGITDMRADIFDGNDNLLETVTANEIGNTGVYRADATVTGSDLWARVYSLSNPRIHSIQRIEPSPVGMALQIESIVDIEYGEWRIEGSQLVFLSRTGIEVARFNLLDSSGKPASNPASAFMRVPA